MRNIKITCLCNVYPIPFNFYIIKLVLQGYTYFFSCYVLLLKTGIDCGYSIEPPQYEEVLTCAHNLCMETVLTCTHNLCMAKAPPNLCMERL